MITKTEHMSDKSTEEYDEYDEYDVCYECTGYGDDYRIENGELVCNCDSCPFNRKDDE